MEEFKKIIVQMLKANMDQQQISKKDSNSTNKNWKKDSNNSLWSHINNK